MSLPPDLVYINTPTVGTGTITLATALPRYRGVSALVDGRTYGYCIQEGSDYEYGRGVYTASGQTLTRNVIKSSNSDNPISLSGAARVQFVLLSEDLQDIIDMIPALIDDGATAGDTTWSSEKIAEVNAILASGIAAALDLKAPLASPALTGNPTAPTQAPGNVSTRLATTAFVGTALTEQLEDISEGVVVPWTPYDCLGLRVWYSADDPADGLVDTWVDRIRGVPVLQADPDHQFTRSATSFNGAYPGLTSSGLPSSAGDGTWMETAPDYDLSFLPSDRESSTFLAVVDQQAEADPEIGDVICNIVGYGGDNPLAGFDTRTIRRRAYLGTENRFAVHAGSNPSLRDTANDFFGCHIVAARFADGTGYGWFDGEPISPASAAIPFNTNTMTTFRISGKILAPPESVDSDFWTGVYRHIFVGNWSDADRERLEGWSAWDSDLVDLLPSDHPYKDAAPTKVLKTISVVEEKTIVPANPGAELVFDATAKKWQFYIDDAPTTGFDVGGIVGEGPLPFSPFTSYAQQYDLTASNANMTRIQGICTDGTYVYFISHTTGYLAKVLATDPTSITATLNLTGINPNFVAPLGMFCDGRYVYVSAHTGGATNSTVVARVDIQNFTTGGITFLDIGTGLPNFNTIGIGMVFDGRYGYAMIGIAQAAGSPLYLARFDTTNFTTGGVSQITLTTPAFPYCELMVSFAIDGVYIYLQTFTWDTTNPSNPVPYNITRVRLSDFTKVDTVSIGTAALSSNGMFFDGRYLWVSPTIGIPMQVMDTFNWPNARTFDISATDATLSRFANGSNAFVRGRYGYFAPVTNTKVLRVDIDNPGSYAVCDLVNTDASAASNFYANMARVGDFIFLCSDKTGGGKFLRLQIS